MGILIKKGQHLSPTTEFKKGLIPWNKYLESKICPNCRKRFQPIEAIRKFCTKDCYSQYQKGKSSNNKNKKFPQYQNGKHPNWKGNQVSYSGLHYWVSRHLGKPEQCEDCGKSGLRGKQIHWANKSHQYKRDLNDWLRLCILCHKRYDRKAVSGEEFRL